mgnify:FL=1
MEELFYPLKHIASIFAILRKTLNYIIMKNFLILSLLLAFLTTEVCAQWKPAGDKIKTQWANKINTSAVLPEYPRPIMERNEWKNLNGLWEYAITDLGGNVPAHFDGQILVPFAVESSLSGVGQRVGAKKELWYSRSFEVPVAWKIKMYYFISVLWTGKQIFG